MKNGFTLIEVLVTAAITGILLSFVYINVLQPQGATSLTSATNTLITDLRSQQLKSMTGENDGVNATPSGVAFGTTSYTLIPEGFVVSLPANTRFSSVAFPSQAISFATASGSVINYSATGNTVTLQWANTATKTITINKYGVITNVN